MSDDVQLKVSLPNVPNIELVAIEGLERLARHLGIDEEKIGDARLLVTEAVINALEHAGGNHSEVSVEFDMTRERLIILVKDQGEGFDPAQVEDPDILKKIGTADKRGWGLKLMKSLSDNLSIETGPGGTKITIVKHLS